MPTMQTQDAQDNEGAREENNDRAQGVLEDPNRVVTVEGGLDVYADNTLVAVIRGEIHRSSLAQASSGFRGDVIDFLRLDWSRPAALKRLQGAHVYDILGPSICLLNGCHRPAWSPVPGVEMPRVLVPRLNPLGLSVVDLFQLAKTGGF